MVPFLASPRKGPHIQMAHYSSIWLCILHTILFRCLTTSISNTGVTIFHEAPPAKRAAVILFFGHISWCGSLTKASESPYQYFSAVRSAMLIFTQVWFMGKHLSFLPWLQLCFSKCTFVSLRQQPTNPSAGRWLRQRERYWSQSNGKTSQQSEARARPNASTLTSTKDLSLSSQLTNSYCSLNICIFLNWRVLCVLFILVQIENVTGKKSNLNENKAKDSHERNMFFVESFFRLTVLNYRCSLIGYGQIKPA